MNSKENLPELRPHPTGPRPLTIQGCLDTFGAMMMRQTLAPLPDDFTLSLKRLLGHPAKKPNILLLNTLFE